MQTLVQVILLRVKNVTLWGNGINYKEDLILLNAFVSSTKIKIYETVTDRIERINTQIHMEL